MLRTLIVQPPGGLTGPYNNTGVPAILHYGDGTNFVNGTVGLGLVEIAGFTIPDQAFINAINASPFLSCAFDFDPCHQSLGQGADAAAGTFGLVGLGFDGPRDLIPAALTAKGKNGTEAANDFATVRANLLQNGPPEIAPQDLINAFDGSSSGSSRVAAHSDAVSGKVSGNLAGNSGSSTDSTVTKYGPLVIGLLAANLVILLVVAVLGILGFVRNGRSTGPAYQPVRFKEDAPLTMDNNAAYSD
ncbi:hypothetical protein C8R47DRAFT_1203748 [Mycena vitilis]|nr:hypothetical protein C8R47DRAFT_1203748 [Mycena vitilis]